VNEYLSGKVGLKSLTEGGFSLELRCGKQWPPVRDTPVDRASGIS
jgi:hypothetical protein